MIADFTPPDVPHDADGDVPYFDRIAEDWDAICDSVKYAEARNGDMALAVGNRLMELAARGQIDIGDANCLREMLVDAHRAVWTAFMGVLGDGDESHYHDGRPVRSEILLEVPEDTVERLAPLADFPSGDLGYFSYTWHPDRGHPRNQTHELAPHDGADHLYGATDDGWTARVPNGFVKFVVAAPGFLETTTGDVPKGLDGLERWRHAQDQGCGGCDV